MTHEEARDLMPLFAVDALDPATRAALLAFVAQSDDARRELQDILRATDALGQDVPQVRPRPELRQRILSEATGQPIVRRTPRVVTTPPDSGVPRVEVPLVPPVRRGWAPWLAAAAALVAAVTSAGLFQTRAELDDVRRSLAVWQGRVEEAERNAETSRATMASYRRQLDVMTADDLLLVTMSGLPPAASAQAKAFVSRSQNAIIFTARDLPALPPAQVYQLWAVAGGQAISVGLFEPDARGRSQVVGEVPSLQSRPDALAVTVEPSGGVPAPTGPKILLGVPAN
jgi:hypothetical protein